MINTPEQIKSETLRTEYKALVEQLKIELGTLENIRFKLALSRRQICKLLMVDPSAWTRWTRAEQDAPPHIYQALKWYMQLIEKNPDVHAPLKLEQRMDLMQKEFLSYVSSNLENKRATSQEQTQQPQKEDAKKALELEIIRYDNKRLQEKIASLETKLATIAINYEQLLVSLEKKSVKPKIKTKPKKKIKLRKKPKKKGKSKKTSHRKKKRKK